MTRRPFWPSDPLDIPVCCYIAILNVALLAVIATRIYLVGV